MIFNIEVRKNSIFTTSEEEEYKRCWPRCVRASKQTKECEGHDKDAFPGQGDPLGVHVSSTFKLFFENVLDWPQRVRPSEYKKSAKDMTRMPSSARGPPRRPYVRYFLMISFFRLASMCEAT